ncbi:MAG: hypothetical protein KDA41_07890, partial [Planctomycetales bacterium]|nr:hypothetical protein [Planctomycetales bacterium]
SIKPPYLVNGVPQDISAIVVDPKASGVVYVGHIDGAVFKSTNATQPFPTWTRVGVDSNLPVRFCHNIFVDPNNSNTVYAGFGMYSTQNIWKSVNGGATWFDASAGLPALPIRAVTVHPRNSNWVYIGTDVGVFQSTDGAATWWPTNKGPVNVSVEQFAWQGDNLYVATYGRGVYAITIPVN